ncbi:FxSxx-COOH system tetratricopeptide repeat protein [Streptomyces sp. NPDC005931]|uniref:FxSxx-COOH system tetratricopeptide repeat protein n=1 Tax=Streptomyces sp. NPDC005931 TaxID=3364737 RepID=UPI00367733A9
MPQHHTDSIEDPVEKLGTELNALYRAAREPSYEDLVKATGTARSTLHEWVAGGSVPASKNRFATLIAVLRRVADREGVPYERHSDAWWEELRRRAWRHKQTAAKHGRRPPPRLTVGYVPVPVDCYENRAGLRDLLETSAPGRTTVLGQVITGMGGVGKTQLAADYAQTAYDEGAVDVLVWITASSRAAVTDGFTDAAARLLGVPHDDPGAAAAFLNWLALAPGTKDSGQVPGARWLIVLDDVPQPEALQGLWPPDVPHGQTLITTRNRDAALMDSNRRRIDVGCFSSEEACSYLDAKLATHGRREAPDQVAGLAEDLGRLPLALSQAIPYMVNRRLDCAAYRARLADRAKTLNDVLPAAGGLPDQQSRTVAAAWDLSIELADQQPPVGLARPALHLVSLLDPNGVPGTVLTAEPVLAALDSHHTTRLASGVPSPDDVQEALWNLHQFSLVEHTPEHPCQTIRVHQLVQRAVHERLPDAVRRAWIATAADALRAAWPEVERDVELAAAFRANTDVLYQRFPEAMRQPVVHDVLYRWGQSLGEAGRADAARDHFQRLIDALDPEVGPDHLYSLSSRNHHARWQGEAGDAAGARDAFEALVPRMRAALGDDHAQTLIARNNAAYWRGRAGDAAGASDGLAELLPDMVRKHGPFHRRVFVVRGNFARWRGEAGDTAGAIAALTELLEDSHRVLGPEDPGTLAACHDLAAMRGEAGDAAGAAEAYRELLAVRRRVLGDHDPNTLQTRSNLAYWLGQAGDPAAAVAAYTEQLEYQSALLGAEHPGTLAVLNNLAGMRGECGDVAGAARSFAEVVALMERVYGDHAPATLTARNNLAYYRGESGDSTGALDAFTKLLSIQAETLGKAHPHTLTTRNNQATWLARTGDPAAAADAFAALIGDTAQVHGTTHPMTLTVLANFAGCLQQVRSVRAAVRALTTALSCVERLYGVHHGLTRLLRAELVRRRSEGTSKKKR